ncbi:hypothetical protein DPMN_077835 [Dreissena polymorpha]|uniref:Uncharacterized protein n=1 Tax=Dreissena polymorpha TaxID=45954 RepID=A0A9D3YL66_DREPO|nr:hypothetical protein DPMN_077835 [Dreissena polymorpha]
MESKSTCLHFPSSLYYDDLDIFLAFFKRSVDNSLTERVVPGEVSKPSQLSLLDGRQKKLFVANKCCCHVLVGRVLYERDAEQSTETV